ncbi:thiamine phosphate synthase [soil metagenome]
MKIIVISPSKNIENETQIVTELFEHGLQTYHLRKPSMSTQEMKNYLKEIPTHFHNRIIIHSHHGLVKKFSLKGIHLTRMHQKKKFYRRVRVRCLLMRKPSLIITTSFQKIASLYENEFPYHYVFLGTIFDIVSEKFNAGYNEHSLKVALPRSITPVIARGGTNAGNISVCQDLGFSGMVFYSGVWKKEKPVEEFCKIIQTCKDLNISPE